MKKIITSVLLAGTLFCLAAPINTGKDSKQGRSKITAVKTKQADKKETKKEKVKKDNYHPLWINNNGGGQTSYH